jgi:Asp/Glu/hydantoin racemase
LDQSPRITLISALAQSIGPAEDAMREVWPDARFNNLVDDSLASDLATVGELTPAIFERFRTLGRYAASATDSRRATAGIMFTCSAFGPCIDEVKAALDIPVIAPNEGAFEEALDLCRAAADGVGRVGLVLTFSGSLEPLSAEMAAIAERRGQPAPQIVSAVAEGALAALQQGEAERHDKLIAEAAAGLPPVDAILLGQFSMARAAPLVRARRSEPVLTTPHAAARKLKGMVEAG